MCEHLTSHSCCPKNSWRWCHFIKAYALINTKIGLESAVLNALKKIEGIEQAYNIVGVYDVIARLKTETIDELKFVITNIKELKEIHNSTFLYPNQSIEDSIFRL